MRPQHSLVDGAGGFPPSAAPAARAAAVPPAAGGPAPPVSEEPEPSPVAPGDTAARLSRLEAELAQVDRRVEELAESLPSDVARAVGVEMRVVAEELRHTVSELGRLLVRDLGRLAKILAGHRDSILAELRGGQEPVSQGSAPADALPASSAPTGDPAAAVPPAPAEAGDGGASGTDSLDAAGAPRRRLGRRRSG